MSKESFKSFVRANPTLASYVNNNSMTWQKFYEMYELYGSDRSVWKDYLNEEELIRNAAAFGGVEGAVKELYNAIKGINLDKVQNGINNIQKTISLVQEFSNRNSSGDQYEKRPTYQHFDD